MKYYISTLGCQMNVLDSELLEADLSAAGLAPAESPRKADVILFNTCSVRQHAEDKVYSALGRLKHLKEHRPQAIIGVLGCMAQKDRETIFRRAPHVDLVVGPGRLWRLPELIAQVRADRKPRIEVSLDPAENDREAVRASFVPYDSRRSGAARLARPQAFVRIMFGCNMACSYCIVPRVRGPEQSRPAAEILDEVRRLVDAGCLEVTLIGQTVNSYADRSTGATLRLADLLERLDALPGPPRIRFVTNHPRFMTDELLQAVRDLPRVCPYLHVPAQSGSDVMLKRMKRGYTAAYYYEMLDRIRALVPEAAITSDFIVGFSGETDDDFEQTVELVRRARFKNSFIFKYSPRPGTWAAEHLPDDVPEAVKRRRNNELLALQNTISRDDNQRLVGQVVEVLVEGPSKAAKKKSAAASAEPAARSRAADAAAGATVGATSSATANVAAPGDAASFEPPEPGRAKLHAAGALQLVGRTVCDQIVVFDGLPQWTGRFRRVRIERADAVTLFGRDAETPLYGEESRRGCTLPIIG